MTMFSTSVPSASSTASPLCAAPEVFAILGCEARAVLVTSGGPPSSSGRPTWTTAGPSPIRRCPGFSAIPPSSGGTLSGEASTTIVSPGDDACSTAASELNGEWIVPSPPGEAVALTYQWWFRPARVVASDVPDATNVDADNSVTKSQDDHRDVDRKDSVVLKTPRCKTM